MASLPKRIFTVATASAGILILFLGVQRILRSKEATVPIANRTAVALAAREEADADRSAAAAVPNARIAPDPGMIVLDALDVNLDTDEDLEQVVVVRDTVQTDGSIGILIADFKPEIGLWLRQWSAKTAAANPVSFAIQVKDLTGEGGSQLVCFGLDAQNRQTLSVFGSRAGQGSGGQGSGGQGAAYATLFSGSAERIELVEPPAQGAPDSPWTIVMDRASPSDTDPWAVMRTIHAWNPRSGSFRPISESLTPGQAIGQELAARVLTGDAAVFEHYIRGLWVRADDGRNLTAIDFDADQRRILCTDPSSTQIFDWKASSPAPTGLLAATVNETLPELMRLVEVQLAGADRIIIRVLDEQVLRISGTQTLNGEYRRAATAAPLFRMEPAAAAPVGGSWISDSGFLLSIEGDRFRARGLPSATENKTPRTDPDQVVSGAVSMFLLDGATVLDLVPVRADGIVEPPLRFHPRFGRADDPRPRAALMATDRDPDLLTLTPVRVRASRVEPLYRESIVLRRIIPDRFESGPGFSR